MQTKITPETIRFKDIPRAANALAAALSGGEVLALSGPLGAGKTYFTKELGRALGVADPIASPTYTIATRYRARLPKTGKPATLYHFDLYRLSSPAEAEQAGLPEALAERGSITVVEWPDRARELLPPHTHEITFAS